MAPGFSNQGQLRAIAGLFVVSDGVFLVKKRNESRTRVAFFGVRQLYLTDKVSSELFAFRLTEPGLWYQAHGTLPLTYAGAEVGGRIVTPA